VACIFIILELRVSPDAAYGEDRGYK